MTPVMLAEYVPADFDAQQRQSAEEALAIIAKESGPDAGRIATVVRQGGIYHEVLEEAKAISADLIVMSSHRPAMRTYFLGSNAGHVVRYATLLGAGGAPPAGAPPTITADMSSSAFAPGARRGARRANFL